MENVRETLAEQTAEQRAVGVQWLVAFREFARADVKAAFDEVLGEVARFEQEETR